MKLVVLRKKLKNHNKELVQLYDKLYDIERKIAVSCTKLEDVQSEIEIASDVNKNTMLSIEKLISAEVKSQIVQLTRDIQLIKGKKD